MLSVLGLSGTDVQGFISMHRECQTQTGHGRGLLIAKDSISNVHVIETLGGLYRIYGSDRISERNWALPNLKYVFVVLILLI